jgi:serine protease Do
MQHRLPVAFLAAMAFLVSTLAYSATVVLPDFTVLVEQQSPSVVKISTVASRMTNSQGQTQEEVPELFRYFFGDQLPENFEFNTPQPSQGLGSGFIISADGYI